MMPQSAGSPVWWHANGCLYMKLPSMSAQSAWLAHGPMLKIGPPNGGITGMYQPLPALGFAAASADVEAAGADAGAIAAGVAAAIVWSFGVTAPIAESAHGPVQFVSVTAGDARLLPPPPVAVPVIGTLTDGCFGSLLVIVRT